MLGVGRNGRPLCALADADNIYWPYVVGWRLRQERLALGGLTARPSYGLLAADRIPRTPSEVSQQFSVEARSPWLVSPATSDGAMEVEVFDW